MSKVLEIVTFKLVPGTDEAAFLKAAEQVAGVIRAMPGFLNRRLAKGADGSWSDVVEWTDNASAQEAAQIFHMLDDAKPFCAMIDMASVSFTHRTVASAA
jgi:hypothetical protein